MKSIDLYTYGSVLKRDGLPVHAMLSGDVRAVCGASGISFTVIGRYSRNENGDFFEIRSSIITKTKNPIGCKKCLKKFCSYGK